MVLAGLFYLCNIIVASTVLLMLLRLRALTAFGMLLYLSTLVLARPLIIYLGLDEPQPSHGFFRFEEDAMLASFAATMWFCIFFATVLFSRKIFFPIGRAILPQVANVHSKIRLRLLVSIVVLLGFIATLFLVLKFGSVARFIFAVKVEKALSGAYIFRQIAVLGMIVSLFGLFHELKNSQSRRQKRGVFLFYGSLIFVCMAVNFAWGNRGNIAYMLVAGGIGWHFYIAPLRPDRIVFFGIALLIAMSILGESRKSAIVAQTGVEYGADNPYREISRSLHFVEFDALALAIRDSGEKFDFRYGEDFINGILAMVPRSILPNRKTFHIGGWLRRVYEPGIVNGWPATVIGDWWTNFGAVGIFLGAVISGIIAGLFDGAYQNPTKKAWDAAMAPCLGVLSFSGGVGTGFPQEIVMTLVPIALFALGLRIRLGMYAPGESRLTRSWRQ